MDLISIIQQQSIKDKALELGFDAVAFTDANELTNDAKRLKEWLNLGYHADMNYMAANFDKRINPSKLVEGTKSVILVLHNYYPSAKPFDEDGYKIARYAYGKDYHDVVKAKLQQLFDYIKLEIFPGLEGRLFTDSAPVLERALAAKAGLGWIGKNTNLIHPKIGSYFFIGELIVNLPLTIGSPINNYCGGCTKCIDACPTQALSTDGKLNSNRCISYLTIENKGEIPDEFTGKFQNRIYGCDICQEVCPWNRKAQPHREAQFEPHPNLLKLTNNEWLSLDEETYRQIFKASAVKRAKFQGLMRNIQFINKTSD